MAEQSVHDVVKQPQSADAPTSADASVANTIDPAVRAAAVNAVSTDHNSNLSTLVPTEKSLRRGQENGDVVVNGQPEDQERASVRICGNSVETTTKCCRMA